MAKTSDVNSNERFITGHVQELVANPTPLGLFGLAIVTLVACTQKLGITGGDAHSTALVIPWAIFLGATAQLIAGLKDFKHNNTFGATAFCAYALFWYGVAMTWMMQNGMFGMKAGLVMDAKQLGYAFLGYFIFTMFMTLGAMGVHKVLFIIFFLIDILFLGLFMYTLGWGGHAWAEMAGYAELLISIFSFYGSAAAVLNTHYGKTVLPVGSTFGPWV